MIESHHILLEIGIIAKQSGKFIRLTKFNIGKHEQPVEAEVLRIQQEEV